ncbi:MAG TPA: 2-hydroxyacid dehydrogenase [Stellaceae bacterium]|nr:2-hydroxyacid dehydrogenase [Stellaceae bacterium]
MKAVLQFRASPGFCARLAALEGLDVTVVAEADKAEFARAMCDADVLLHALEPVTEAVMEGAPLLRLIQKIGVGVNTIDLDAARRRGIAVCNMPGTNTQAVAEMTMLLMLAVLRRVTALDVLTRAGEGWTPPLAVIDALGELGGREVGLLGFGAVGRRLVPMLHGFGARVVYTARQSQADAGISFLPLAELLRRVDILSLHLPLAPATARIIDAAALAAMKRGSILINTARGGLVDEAALHAALTSGHLAAAGLDVFDQEPVPASNPLLALDNIVATPHLSWLTAETLDRSLGIIIENCRRLGAGKKLLHRVV